MTGRMSESTEALLEAYELDLQLQLRRIAVVERLAVRDGTGGVVTLVATVHVATRRLELAGTGENIVAAYGSLTQALPELVLANAYREVLERALGS